MDNSDPFNSISAQFMCFAQFIGSQQSRNGFLVSPLHQHLLFQYFQFLLANITPGLVDVAVVQRLDRQPQNLSGFQQILGEFKARDEVLVSVTPQLDMSNHVGR